MGIHLQFYALTMSKDFAFLAPQQALMVRQELQVLENFIAVCEKNNIYNIKSHPGLPIGPNGVTDEATDEYFRSLPDIGRSDETSTCMCRVCCGKWREFTMANTGTFDGQPFNFSFERPFKCSIPCFCVMFNPQIIFVKDGGGAEVGHIVQDWNCKRWIQYALFPSFSWYYSVNDAAGQRRYVLRVQYPSLCNGCRNLCAPTCLHKTFEVDIFNADESAVVGRIVTVFPGCTCAQIFRSCTNATNLGLEYPPDASPEDKALLYGGLMLLEFLFFEKKANDNN